MHFPIEIQFLLHISKNLIPAFTGTKTENNMTWFVLSKKLVDYFHEIYFRISIISSHMQKLAFAEQAHKYMTLFFIRSILLIEIITKNALFLEFR